MGQAEVPGAKTNGYEAEQTLTCVTPAPPFVNESAHEVHHGVLVPLVTDDKIRI